MYLCAICIHVFLKWVGKPFESLKVLYKFSIFVTKNGSVDFFFLL